METRSLEVLAYVGDDGSGLGRQRDRWMLHEPVDVVDAEPDPFEMEGGDGAPERLALFEQPGQLLLLRRHAADNGQELVEPGLGRLAVFGGHDG